MSTANKLTYLNTTKEKIKQAINNLGGDIDNETTFREYVEELENIYDNLPKTEYAEGTEVTLTPTRKGRLALIPKGNSIQEGTPTPDTPFPIKNVTGENNVVVRGKNLLKLTDVAETTTADNVKYKVENNKLYINGTVQTAFTPFVENLSIEIPNGTYTMSAQLLSGTISGSTNCSFKVKPQISGGETYSAIFGNQYTTNTFIDKVVRAFCNINSGITFNNAVIGFQIETGNQDTTFEPYYTPQTKPLNLGDIELNGIGDYKDLIFKAVNGNSFYDSLTAEQKALLTYGKWYKHEEIGKVVLNGSETWGNIQGIGNIYRISINITDIKNIEQNADFLGLSNRFVKSVSVISGTNVFAGAMCQYRNTNTLYFAITQNTKTDFVTWLTSNNVILNYILATPTDIEITDTNLINQLEEIDKMQSYNGTTIITSTYEEGNAQMIIKARALRQLS